MKNYHFEITFIDGSKSQQSVFSDSIKSAWKLFVNTYFEDFDHDYLSVKIKHDKKTTKELLNL